MKDAWTARNFLRYKNMFRKTFKKTKEQFQNQLNENTIHDRHTLYWRFRPWKLVKIIFIQKTKCKVTWDRLYYYMAMQLADREQHRTSDKLPIGSYSNLNVTDKLFLPHQFLLPLRCNALIQQKLLGRFDTFTQHIIKLYIILLLYYILLYLEFTALTGSTVLFHF